MPAPNGKFESNQETADKPIWKNIQQNNWPIFFFKCQVMRGTCLAQLAEHGSLDFRVISLSPTMGIEIPKKQTNFKISGHGAPGWLCQLSI